MIQMDSHTSYVNSEVDDRVSDDDSLCRNSDDTKNVFENELYNSVNLDDSNHHPIRLKYPSE